MKAAILIPVFNEVKTIQDVVKQALEHCPDVIVVVDGSTDRTLEILLHNKSIHLLVHVRNLGLTEALKTGFRYALKKGFDCVVKIDGDGQMNLNQYHSILNRYYHDRPDIVTARYNPNTPWMIKKDIWIYSFLFNLAIGIGVSDILSEYRLFSRKAMTDFINLSLARNASNISLIGLVKQGCHVTEINEGVNYQLTRLRPAYLQMLIDCRIQFVLGLWKYQSVRSRITSVVSIPILILLLIFNITFGYRYNTFLPKSMIRK